MTKFDENDEKLRETHIPKSKFDDKGQLKMNVKYQGPPGPGTYSLTGDFDFRDPSKPEDRTGKLPKFVFGSKPVDRPQNLYVPGPGQYASDVAPLWMAKQPAYPLGSACREEMAVRNSAKYPGPCDYDLELPIGGPQISFPRELKHTEIEKTYAPGPASYVAYTTVGNAHGYLRNETNPRITAVASKQMD